MAVAAAAADGRLLHLPDAAGEGYDADIDRNRRTAASARAQILPAAPAVRSEMPGDGAADRGAGPPAKHIEKHQQARPGDRHRAGARHLRQYAGKGFPARPDLGRERDGRQFHHGPSERPDRPGGIRRRSFYAESADHRQSLAGQYPRHRQKRHHRRRHGNRQQGSAQRSTGCARETGQKARW